MLTAERIPIYRITPGHPPALWTTTLDVAYAMQLVCDLNEMEREDGTAVRWVYEATS
jgi:hypothetical protein